MDAEVEKENQIKDQQVAWKSVKHELYSNLRVWMMMTDIATHIRRNYWELYLSAHICV